MAVNVSATNTGTQKVGGATAETASLTAGSLNADLVASTDVSGSRWAVLQVTGTFSGTLTFQGSNDNTNFVSLVGVNTAQTAPAGVVSTTTVGVYAIPLGIKYFRVRMTAYTSGTATGTLELFSTPSAVPWAATQITGNLADSIADSGNPLKVGGKYNATNPTYSDGARADLQIGSRGSLRVELFGSGSATAVGSATAASDAIATSVGLLNAAAYGHGFNGTTWDRNRTGKQVASVIGKLAVTTGIGSMTALSAVTSTGAGTALDLGAAYGKFALQVKHTGSPATVIVTIEGSVNGTDYMTIGTWTAVSQANGDIIFVTDKPCAYVRANLTTLTGGTAPTVTATLASAVG